MNDKSVFKFVKLSFVVYFIYIVAALIIGGWLGLLFINKVLIPLVDKL